MVKLGCLHSFNNGLHLMASFRALDLTAIKHNTMFYLGRLSNCRRCILVHRLAPTLLYRPLPSGSAIATTMSSFFDFKYCPTPATVPPVPILWCEPSTNVQDDQLDLTCTSNECIHVPAGLSPYLWTCSQVMGIEIAFVLRRCHEYTKVGSRV